MAKTNSVRESGHYWVKWSGTYTNTDIWRMGAYIHPTGWKLVGDERTYYDSDFIEVNENRIPFKSESNWFWHWAAVIAHTIAACTYFYYTLKR